MDFSLEELVCLNTFLDRQPVEGIPLRWKYSKSEEEQGIQQTVQSLKDRGYVEADGTFSVLGATVLKLLQQYKESSKKVFINHMRVGLLDNYRVVILALNFNEKLEVKSVSMQLNGRAEVFFATLHLYPDICKAYKPFFVPRSYELQRPDFYKQINNINMQNIIYLSKKSKESEDTCVYYWSEEVCYAYNYQSNVCEEWEVGAIRKYLAELLEVNEYE